MLRGKEPDGGADEFKTLYTEKEQGRLKKLMRVMLFSNYLMNYIYKKPWKEDHHPGEPTSQDGLKPLF